MTLLVKKPRGSEFLVPSLWESFDRLFDGFAAPWNPAIDVVETSQEIKIKADLPGMDEKDVKVELNDGYLTITGERKEEQEEKGAHTYSCERRYGRFSRVLPIDVEIKENEVAAKFKNGTLEILLPKAKEDKPQARVIPIQK